MENKIIVFSQYLNLIQYAFDENGFIGFCLFDKIMITKYGFEILKNEKYE
jgi:hypothetical protein